MTYRPLIIGIAPDSFKGSLTAEEATLCIEEGLKRALKNIRVRRVPMADGGEGTVKTIINSTLGRYVYCTVHDPLGRLIRAKYGITGDGGVAVIEMAEANGLILLKPRERNPLKTTTFGTGDLIQHAMSQNVRKIIIGIGGSATNDGGFGMAMSLGVKFRDKQGKLLEGGCGSLDALHTVDIQSRDLRLNKVKIEVACDVNNKLTGKNGASYVYGPQKGATLEIVKVLDRNLRRLARVVKRDLGVDMGNKPGTGAAGGLGGGLVAFVGATLRPGVDTVMDVINLKKRLKGCHLVITGEGCMDRQTLSGKTPSGVARIACELGIPVVAVCGSLGRGVEEMHGIGISAYFSSLTESCQEAQIKNNAPSMLTSCAEEVGRLIGLKLKSGPSFVLRK